MDYNRQNDHYALRLAGDLLNCCENGTADFLNPASFPYYTQDALTKQVLNDAGQLQTLLRNAAHGSQYINYAPTYIIQDSKKEWMNSINNKENDRDIGCIIYKGKDENGNKHYEMMSPAKRFNPGGINESPTTQIPVPNIGIYRQTPSLDPGDPKGIEKYITGVIGNYFNAAFTKTPYYPPQWGGQETEMLSKALNADPSIALRTAQNAFNQATSVKMENAVNQELNDNVKEAIRQGLPPFNTKKQETITGPVNANGYGVPANGIDFINSYYNTLNGNTSKAVTHNGYIPYQTHNESPKDIDKYLVEQYGNIINASLTGTPYSGSVTPAQLKTLSSGVEAKIANDPAYMSGIVNQAQQNVLGFNYMPYDKNDFISRAQDPSSREFKLLNQTIANHVKDICMKNKPSFNGEFQELSKELTEKIKNTDIAKEVKKPAAKASTAKKEAKPPAGAAAIANHVKDICMKNKPSFNGEFQELSKELTEKIKNTDIAKEVKKPAAKASTTKKEAKPPAGAAAENGAKKPAAKASTAKKEAKPPAGAAAANEVKKPAARTSTVKEEANPSVSASALKEEIKPSSGENTGQKEERPSFLKEVTDFVKDKIVEKKPALVLVDTYLGAMVDKAKKIVRTGKTIAAAFVIAANVAAPNLQWTIADHLSNIPVTNKVSISVNHEDFKSAANGTVKAGENSRQIQNVKSAARR